MKEARCRTQLSGAYGCDEKGFLDAEIKREAARTRYISDIVGQKKDFEGKSKGCSREGGRLY